MKKYFQMAKKGPQNNVNYEVLAEGPGVSRGIKNLKKMLKQII